MSFDDIRRIEEIERQIVFIKKARKDKSYMGCGIVLDLHIGVPNDDELQCNPNRQLSNISLGQGEDAILGAIEDALVGSLRNRLTMLNMDHTRTTEFLHKRGCRMTGAFKETLP